MAERDTVAVTGVTGSLGRLVAEGVADLDPVLLARDPTRAPEWAAEVRACDFAEGAAGEAALRGADVLMFVSATESKDRRDVHRTSSTPPRAAESGTSSTPPPGSHSHGDLHVRA